MRSWVKMLSGKNSFSKVFQLESICEWWLNEDHQALWYGQSIKYHCGTAHWTNSILGWVNFHRNSFIDGNESLGLMGPFWSVVFSMIRLFFFARVAFRHSKFDLYRTNEHHCTHKKKSLHFHLFFWMRNAEKSRAKKAIKVMHGSNGKRLMRVASAQKIHKTLKLWHEVIAKMNENRKLWARAKESFTKWKHII